MSVKEERRPNETTYPCIPMLTKAHTKNISFVMKPEYTMPPAVLIFFLEFSKSTKP